jgi:hypothetical protein
LGIFATVRADFAFIGASGLEAEEGCSNTQLFEAEMTRAILARATRKILLADGTKWGHPSDRIASFEVDPQPSSGLISAASSQEIDSPSLARN